MAGMVLHHTAQPQQAMHWYNLFLVPMDYIRKCFASIMFCSDF